jgi:heme exporter protein A
MNSAGHARLEAGRLTCVRAERTLFRDLDFALRAGETLQVGGANGSGKSSLLRVLAGLLAPESGSVSWDGADIGELGPEFLLHLQYLGHHDGVKLDLTPRENLEFARCLGAPRSTSGVGDALERAGIAGQADVPARRLSAGQRRRTALARLLLMDADLWLLDEPFTALDDDGRGVFGNALAEHRAAGGIAVIATHEALPAALDAKRLTL